MRIKALHKFERNEKRNIKKNFLRAKHNTSVYISLMETSIQTGTTEIFCFAFKYRFFYFMFRFISRSELCNLFILIDSIYECWNLKVFKVNCITNDSRRCFNTWFSITSYLNILRKSGEHITHCVIHSLGLGQSWVNIHDEWKHHLWL